MLIHDFADEDEALGFAIDNQRHRRNLTDQEWGRLILAADRLLKTGRPKSVTTVTNPLSDQNRSSAETAKKPGLGSRKKVDQMRAIVKHAEETDGTEEKEMISNAEA